MASPVASNITPRHATYAGFRATVKAIGTGERGRRALAFEEARDAMRAVLEGEATAAQTGAFLIAMRLKGETPDELAGLAQGLRDAATKLSVGGVASGRPLIACAGAYDGVSEAPLLSVAIAVVTAAAGAAVVMHCGTTLGPKYGTNVSDVIAAMGGTGRPTPAQSESMLATSGVSLVHAGESLAGWSALAAIRDEVGPRGPVHSAEKLVDYFGAHRFVVGYTHQPYAERLARALDRLGAECGVAVRGIEGSDVARPGRPIAHDATGALELPEQLGDRLPVVESVADSAALTQAAIRGQAGRIVDYTVALNAGLRLQIAGLAPNVLRGMAAARQVIAGGQASRTLDQLLSA